MAAGLAALLGGILGLVVVGGHFQAALDKESERADTLAHEVGLCRQGMAMAHDKLDQCEARCPAPSPS